MKIKAEYIFISGIRIPKLSWSFKMTSIEPPMFSGKILKND